MVLLGPTGAGKTTTLRLVAGLEKPDAGAVAIAGEDVTSWQPAERNVAMVFQQYSLYPHLTVRENLAFPLKSPLLRHAAAGDRAQGRRRRRDASHRPQARQPATHLSGGEMQRVSIGRALVRKPAIYLMDEPLSSLDAKLRAELRVELKRIQAELGATVLYVTHDQVEAMTMATHVGVLHEGRLVQFGTPREVYESPASIYVATRLGQPRINIVPLDMFPGLPSPHGASSLGLRPEHIAIGKSGRHRAKAKVRRIEHLGDQTRMHLQVNGSSIVTLTDSHSQIQFGEELWVAPSEPLFFDAAGARITS